MSASDSDDDSYNERSALVPSENPVVPTYAPDPDLDTTASPPPKQVRTRLLRQARLPAEPLTSHL